MSEEDVLAAQPAPEQDVTATPAPEVATPEDKPAEATKTFTQEELDAIVSKRLAREQRKWEREQATRQTPKPAPVTAAEPPSADQFQSPEAYAEALAERKAEELLRQREFERQRFEILDAYHEKEEEVRAKYDDFEQVAYNPNLPITPVMAESIQASDIGPEVAYFLGANPKEAERISRLQPFLQAKEIGKIEAKLAANPPVKKTTNAPAPISPVTAKSSGQPAYDTTDPRSIKTMSTSEWIEAERQRQIKKLEAASRYR
jgi:hypothetical protein